MCRNQALRTSGRRGRGAAVAAFGITIALSVLLWSPQAVAQQTWIVDVMGGAGSQFTQVQPAINAAAPGDVILIRPGASSFYNGFTLSKGVTIMPEFRAWGVRITSDFSVRGLPAGQTAKLKRLTGYSTAALLLEDNAGTVYVERCQHGFQNGYLSIRNSRQVVLNHVIAIDARIESSFVTMNRGLSDASFPQDPLLTAIRSVVVFGNSILVGSRANYNGATCTVIVPPGEAISGYDSVLVLGAGTTLRGGRLSVGGGSCPPISLVANAIGGSNMVVIQDPAATVTQVGPGVTVRTASQPTLDGIVGDEVQGRLDFDLLGTPGSAAALIASVPTDPLWTPYGFQWVDLNASFVADLAVIDPTGHRRTSFAMPLGYPLGEPMLFQSIVLDQGTLVWSTPSAIVRN